jgi:hypothetical protein
METQIYLSRRNLLALLSKLDRKAAGEESYCTIIKRDNLHDKYPQSMSSCRVTAVEDEEYYTTREAGVMFLGDIKNSKTVL